MTSSSQAWKRPKSPSAGARSLISHLQPGQKIPAVRWVDFVFHLRSELRDCFRDAHDFTIAFKGPLARFQNRNDIAGVFRPCKGLTAIQDTVYEVRYFDLKGLLEV